MAQITPVDENILSDGMYDPRMYDLDFEKEPRKRGEPLWWRVIRGLGNHIGYVRRHPSGLWSAYDRNKRDLDPGTGWQRRWVAAHHVSHNVPLTEDAEIADPDAFRVTKEDTPA